ncbi:MAG: dienelactone hydrolase family protein [Chloroflexota bacterium]
MFKSNGAILRGHLSLPKAPTGQGVLVLHAWWGLNQVTINIVERLAQAGFVAFAPDYYDGQIATTIDAAKSLRQQMNRKAVQKLTVNAVDFLAQYSAVSAERLNVMGYSLGASFAIEMARKRPKIVNKVVLFYGSGGGKFDKSNAAFLGHFASDDQWGAHTKKIKALAQRIQSANQTVNFYTYPDTKHWFAESDRPEYRPEAAQLAWERTLTFLRNE